MWKPGDRLSHRYNPDLGPGLVVAQTGRRLLVHFPESDESLRFAADSDALKPLVLTAGSRALYEPDEEVVLIDAQLENELYRLVDGREISIRELWPLPALISPAEQLARGKVDSPQDFVNRLDALRLQVLREADGLGSFLGGRIRLFPHQLYVADRACRVPDAETCTEAGTETGTETDEEVEADTGARVRWLLADEVGLGKTVEACLIMNRLLRTGRAESTLVVAPETLTVQWLTELWRKYHQIFVLVDLRRLEDVAKEHGPETNPFDIYRQAIVSFDLLKKNPQLALQAAAAAPDLLVVDEAHHLKRPPETLGNELYRAVAPVAQAAPHTLLLTATPLEDDAFGFFRLLQLLRPDIFPEDTSFDECLASRDPFPPCTSATRREDIGGLPPRVGVSIDIDEKGWAPMRRLEDFARGLPIKKAAGRELKAECVRRALASSAAAAPVFRPLRKPEVEELLDQALETDPRTLWITAQASRWRKRNEKTLLFVADRETLEFLKDVVERRGRVQVGIFHEDLTPERRDIEVAQFRLDEGPAMLISTECGGEGRNFEFCKRLVLFDLPWNPATVEQRIGRLDRIGRQDPTEIVFFRPPNGFGHALVELYEGLGLFEAPLGGRQRELRSITEEVEQVALEGPGEVEPAAFKAILERVREDWSRVQEAAYHELHRDPYLGEMKMEVLARVPEELDELTEKVVMRAAARFGFGAERQSGERAWLIEFGSHALVDHLPGVVAGSRFLGTFDREEAVADESLEFFASGHPLIEGILAELEDGPRGRAALLQVEGKEEAFGLLAIYRVGAGWKAFAVDNRGKQRPDLADVLTSKPLRPQSFDTKKWVRQRSWRAGILRMAENLPDAFPQAVAAFHIRPAR
jgi:ATP-dependent helicase HepA